MIPKFRAWHKEWKSMLNADDVWIIDFQSRCIQYDVDEYVMCIVDFKDIHLMQSTGMNDKNGVEIFDGDIVKVEVPNTAMSGIYGVRRFRSGAWRIDRRTDGRELWLTVEDAEVIGNIYENKELTDNLWWLDDKNLLGK